MKSFRIMSMLLCIVCTVIFSSANAARRTKHPEHPSNISYEPLDWQVPQGTPYRTTLGNGLRIYIAEDHSLPLVKFSAYVKTGSVNDPDGKEGLGAFMVHMMRTGGTDMFSAEAVDAVIEQYALSLSLSIQETQLQIKGSFLSQFTDTALAVIEQILFHPSFEPEKIEKERAIALQSIRHRFDNPGPVLEAAYGLSMYPGEENSVLSDDSSISVLSRADLVEKHKQVFQTQNIIVAIAGDFEKEAMKEKLTRLFPQADDQKISEPNFPQITPQPSMKCLIVHKEISQAYVRIGIPLFQRPHPDYYPLSLANLILGGGGFTSRLGTKIRSDEGLTYSIYSQAEGNYVYPGTFYINFFTNQASINKALDLTLQEVEKFRTQGISDEELENGKKVLVDGLPSMFRSPYDVVDTYAWNEYYNRDDDHYKQYPGKIQKLSKSDIQEVTKKYIDPSEFTFVIVGDTTALFAAEKSGSFSLKTLSPRQIITPDKLYQKKLFE